MKRYLGILALAALVLTPVPPALAGARVYVRIGPPAPIVEVRPGAPSPRHLWIPGYHRWDGRAHVWVPGRWELPPSHYRVWAPGHWVHHRHHGWYWVRGHWRR
jgi:hypothetical protein